MLGFLPFSWRGLRFGRSAFLKSEGPPGLRLGRSSNRLSGVSPKRRGLWSFARESFARGSSERESCERESLERGGFDQGSFARPSSAVSDFPAQAGLPLSLLMLRARFLARGASCAAASDFWRFFFDGLSDGLRGASSPMGFQSLPRRGFDFLNDLASAPSNSGFAFGFNMRVMAAHRFFSAGLTKLMAWPCAPARAVRPMRWT